MEPFQQQHEDFEATPAARKRAEELRIDLTVVEGTGSNGRVTRDDVEAHAAKLAHRGGKVDAGAETPSIPEPGEHIRPPGLVPPATPGATMITKAGEGIFTREQMTAMGGRVRFRCPTNPNFNLQSRKLGKTIYFTEGCYETSDPTEIAVLRACQFVEEVAG